MVAHLCMQKCPHREVQVGQMTECVQGSPQWNDDLFVIRFRAILHNCVFLCFMSSCYHFDIIFACSRQYCLLICFWTSFQVLFLSYTCLHDFKSRYLPKGYIFSLISLPYTLRSFLHWLFCCYCYYCATITSSALKLLLAILFYLGRRLMTLVSSALTLPDA